MNIIQYDTYIGTIKNKTVLLDETNKQTIQSVEDASYERILESYKQEIDMLEDIYIPPYLKTPSELSGMSEIEELKTRIFCNTMIQESGIVLRLPQTTILTAMNIFNRFYWKNSLTAIEPFHIICACIFIATKSEETLRRMRDVISSSYYILKKREKGFKIFSNAQKDLILDITSIEYSNIKTNVMAVETYILKELGFFLYELSDHPHKYLIHVIKHLRGTRELLQKSWNYLNDAYRTSMAVNYPSNVLACAAIFLAARNLYVVLPNNVKWWEAFDTRIEDIQEVTAEILNMYELGKIELNEVRKILINYSIIEEEKIKAESFNKEKVEEKGKERKRKEYYRISPIISKSKSRKKKKYHERSRSKDYEESRKHRRGHKYRKGSDDSSDSNKSHRKKRKYSNEKRERHRSKSRSHKNSKKRSRSRSYSSR